MGDVIVWDCDDGFGHLWQTCESNSQFSDPNKDCGGEIPYPQFNRTSYKTCAVLGLSDQVHVGTASVFGIVFTLATIVFQVIVILFATRQLRKRKLDEQTEMGEN